ncbi:hypothetical protein G6F35_015138 [Rhizopus arrhizus]|nr:hypothetical protein G6F35_015138 [Rhizopus arrhizus]KAG1250293.1 hypothetical protein G6F68_012878 [Rhizopus microsporus]
MGAGAYDANRDRALRVRYAVEAFDCRHVGLCHQREPVHHEDPSLNRKTRPCRGRVRVDCRLREQSAPANRYGLSQPAIFHDAARKHPARVFGSALDHTVRRRRKTESSVVRPGYTGVDQQQLTPEQAVPCIAGLSPALSQASRHGLLAAGPANPPSD